LAQIFTYIRFNGKAKEAFDFYKQCLGGELAIQTIAESPMAQFMPDKKDQVFHAQLTNGKFTLLGSDMVGEEGLKYGNNMVATLQCESKEEAKDLFTKLSAGGKVGHELAEQPWGMIGDFQDRFNVDWFVVSM